MGARLTGLDALRGIAALVVAAFVHQHYLLGWRPEAPFGVPAFVLLQNYGEVAVDLFFVISGFVFGHVYFATGRITATGPRFALARFARLYPLHLITLLATVAVLAVGQPAAVYRSANDGWHFLLNLLMLQDSGLNSELSFNRPSWSVSVEVGCYAIFYFIGRRHPAVMLPMAIALAGLGIVLSFYPEVPIGQIGRGLCGFFVGVIAWHLRTAGILACLAVFLVGAGILAVGLPLKPGIILSLSAWPALVILVPRIAWLGCRSLKWLGDRSYSIYLIHAPTYFAVNVVVFGGERVSADAAVATMTLSLLAVVALADLSFQYFEKPLRGWLVARGSSARHIDAATDEIATGVIAHTDGIERG